VKLARQHGVEELLPYTVKGTEERLRRRAENGLRVKGTGVGQRVKGKESERTLKGRYVLGILPCDGDFDMQLEISCKGICADDVLSQVGEAQTSYVGDAANDTDVERGKLIHHLQLLHLLIITRSEAMVVDGRNGPNKYFDDEKVSVFRSWRAATLWTSITLDAFCMEFGVKDVPL
jgi:Mitochondrial ribosomal protein mL59